MARRWWWRYWVEFGDDATPRLFRITETSEPILPQSSPELAVEYSGRIMERLIATTKERLAQLEASLEIIRAGKVTRTWEKRK